ncbi:hypothetical protein WR25_20163 isoform A [Diploscapter pachys]|uniref:G-protein coupled receptors family 1 profile domain-containing protein n=1 Tax=Diploscapter pachys TaxID=2018661 RepID=A0A2A2LDZ9_9BILA|nr:hypothetical protein WR25_20163 isoform A [Diploscapter pachys]
MSSASASDSTNPFLSTILTLLNFLVLDVAVDALAAPPMHVIFYFYVFLGVIQFISSSILLATVIVQARLREKYSILIVKFLVDIATAICLIVIGALNRDSEKQCSATLVISTAIPLAQVLLLLCEVIDWILAAFSPIYFHSSSLFSRILPFIVGAACGTIIMTALIIIDVTQPHRSCIKSPTGSAVTTAYDFSLGIATMCVFALGILLHRNLNSNFFRPVAFHFFATLFLIELPLTTVICLNYLGNSGAFTGKQIF